MALGTASAIGAALGGLGGLLSKKGGGSDAGNIYANADMQKQALSNIQQAMNNQPTSAGATGAVQSSPIFSQLFGDKGTLSRTTQEEQDLANRGFSLKPEDYEAYGQASGNVARMFGQQEKGLAQALADRGMSNSGASAIQFSGLQGNKMEQLAGLQRQIADDRMKMNLDRLNSTRGFLTNMGNQAQQAVQGEYGRQLDTNQNQYNQSRGYLGDVQNQANQQQAQRQGSEKSSDVGNFVSGATGGALQGFNLSNAFNQQKIQNNQNQQMLDLMKRK